jgi:mono/diheme cytochrome c family protein
VKRAALWLFLPIIASAQDTLDRGVEIFNRSCATGYCHQVKGGAGGAAPRLAARGFDADYIMRVIRMGIEGTPMPAFGTSLSRADLMAVVGYVNSLNGISAPVNSPANPGSQRRKLAPQAQLGRELFIDQVRGLGRCSTCHQADGVGLQIASPIEKVPESVAMLRQLDTPGVSTATAEGAAGDAFPVLLLSHGSRQTKVYDLSVPPPVLRIFPATAISIAKGSAWRHASILTAYSDADLEAVLAFLREVVHR